jgi:hypothetical protein
LAALAGDPEAVGDVGPGVSGAAAKAFADMTVRMAFDNKVMSSSNNTVYKPKLPELEPSKRFPAK